MNIQIIDPTTFPHWNRQIAAFQDATAFHTANWARVLVETYRYNPRYFCTFNNGQLENVVPVLEIRSSLTGKRGVCLPFSDQVEPLVQDQAAFDILLDYIIGFGKKKGWQALAFHGCDQLLSHEPAYKSYVTSSLSIEESCKTLFKQLKSNTRRNIKKAQKANISTQILQSEKGIKAFYQLNCLTRRDHGLPPQPYLFFKRLHANFFLKEKGFVCLAFQNNIPIAGVLFLSFNRHAMYKYGASDKNHLKLRPNNMSMWEAIKHCNELGLQQIDLGRTDMEHEGLRRFKKSWNAVEGQLKYYRYDFQESAFTQKQERLKSSYGFLKKMPLPLLRVFGCIMYRHVG
ncbi:MAG: GNAT family N-acetyltransferase [Deltaproteobacteria bacterium]|nr:GNAT family N-acetyltransferase [Deltaproteobacteria bacterium]